MRLPRTFQCLSIPLLFSSIFFASQVAAQNLPKLASSSSVGAASTEAAAATTAAATSQSEDATSKSAIKATTTSATPAKASSSDALGLTGLPKLAQDNYPAPTVPPTSNAPFMQKSTLPEGTVFICVGAAIGFLGFLVLAWRGLVAWSLHRSVKRAAIAQSAKYARVGDPRANPSKTKSPYFTPGPGSTLSLDQLGAMSQGGKGGTTQRSARGSLFFSPTAGTGMQTPINRGSGYLPAGYYAAGNSAPGSGPGMTHIGGGSGAIGLSNLGPQGQRYSRARSTGPSPPGSPSLPPSRGGESAYGGRLSPAGLTTHPSNSTLNLSAAPQSRAPSAYLEDLFANHPPGTPPPEEHRRGSRGMF